MMTSILVQGQWLTLKCGINGLNMHARLLPLCVPTCYRYTLVSLVSLPSDSTSAAFIWFYAILLPLCSCNICLPQPFRGPDRRHACIKHFYSAFQQIRSTSNLPLKTTSDHALAYARLPLCSTDDPTAFCFHFLLAPSFCLTAPFNSQLLFWNTSTPLPHHLLSDQTLYQKDDAFRKLDHKCKKKEGNVLLLPSICLASQNDWAFNTSLPFMATHGFAWWDFIETSRTLLYPC